LTIVQKFETRSYDLQGKKMTGCYNFRSMY